MQEVLVSKIFNYTSTPTKNVEGQFWFNPSTNVLSRFNGTAWKPITVSSDDVAVLTNGNKVSLTSYLNTQIAALAEGIDSKQDKLKFYSEVDKSADTSADSTGSEINLKTSASQYGGSNINLIASNGQYNSGNINLKAKSHNTSGGGNIILESGGGSASGGNITLHSKVNSGGYAEPGGQINIIAESTQTGDGSNISLTAKNIQLKGELSGSGISTYIKGTTPDNESPDITVVDTKVPSEKAVYNAVNTKANKSTTLSGYGITDAYTKTEVDTKLKDYETKEDFDGYTSMVLSTYQQKTDITLETTNKTIVRSINEINENTSKKQDKLSYYSENTTTNKADISIDGKSTGKSEFSINVTDSTGDNSGDSTINLFAGSSAGSVSNGAGKINLEVSGSSGGKISLTAINGADSFDSGIELNVPFGPINESYVGENSGIIFNGPISGTGITKTITDVDYKLPTSKAVKTELDKKQNNLSLYSEGEVDNAAGWVNIGKDTSKISAGAGDVTLTGAGDVTLTARQNITLDAGSTIEIKNATSISGSVIAGSISSEDTGISGQIPTVGAVATSLNTKQDKLVSYSETTLPPEAGTAGGKTTVDINALSLQITTDTNLAGSAIFKGGSVYVESKLCTNELVVSESITGNAVLSSISSKPVDTKILSEKAIKTELDKKQDTLKTFSENKTDPNTYTVNINASQTCINSKLEVKDTLSTDGNIELGGKIMRDGVDVLATKQDSLKYYSEDTTKAVSKLSSKRLEVNAYNTDGNTYNPLILNDKQGIAIGGNNPSAQDLYAYLNIGDNDGTSLMLSTPVGYSDLRYDGITFKDTNDNLQFGFNNKTYNLLTERAAGLYYLKDTDAKSTGIAIDPDRISLIDYNKYSDDPYISDTSDSHCFFESTKISNGQIQLQTRINGSSEFINEGTISPDCIKLGSGRFGSALDPSADIVITTTQTEDTFAGHFHGIAYDGDTYGDGANNRWYIGTDVDKTGQSSKPIIGKPYIKGFANAEFSEKVQATTIQAGKEVSSSSGVATLTEGGLSINTPAGVASFKYDGIEISNAGFKVHGQNGTSTVYPYVQIPDSNGNSFKIWKGTEEQFKALTLVDFDTVYLRIQDNNRIKATVGTDTASLENITDSYTLSSNTFTSFITDTKYNNAQGSILITPSLTNSGALIFGEGVTDTSKGFPLYPDNIVSIPFKNITNFKVAGNLNDSFNYIVSFDI